METTIHRSEGIAALISLLSDGAGFEGEAEMAICAMPRSLRDIHRELMAKWRNINANDRNQPRDRHFSFEQHSNSALTVPAPSSKELSDSVRIGFSFPSNLTEEEEVLAKADNRDRALAIRLLEGLPGGRFAGSGAYWPCALPNGREPTGKRSDVRQGR